MHGVYKQRYIVGVWTEKSAFSLERQAGGRPLRQTKLSAVYLRSVSAADKRSGPKFACFTPTDLPEKNANNSTATYKTALLPPDILLLVAP